MPLQSGSARRPYLKSGKPWVRVENLQILLLFADTDKPDRLTGDRTYRQCCAVPRVSPSSFVKITPVTPAARQRFSTLTASWPVMASTTSRDLLGLNRRLDLLQFIHQHFIDRSRWPYQSGRCRCCNFRVLYGSLANLHRFFRPLFKKREHRPFQPIHLQLLNRGRAVNICRHQQRTWPCFFNIRASFPPCCFTGVLQAAQHDNCRRRGLLRAARHHCPSERSILH